MALIGVREAWEAWALSSFFKRFLSLRPPDIDDNGRIIRSPDALRPLTLCNCDCKLPTTANCRGLQRYTMRCLAEMHLFQTDDGQHL